jgi:hypothetical protein
MVPSVRVSSDEQRIDNLKNIQGQIINYWQTRGQLPSALKDLSNSNVSKYRAPKDPKTGDDYYYEEEKPFREFPTFKLCANFDSTDNIDKNRPVDLWDMVGEEHWNHDQGYQCFVRIIDTNSFPFKPINP